MTDQNKITKLPIIKIISKDIQNNLTKSKTS